MNARETHIVINRSARLFLLGGTGAVRDVWIACHGYGQLPGRFIRGFQELATPERLIVAPEGLHRFYLDPPPAPAAKRRVGASWMTREDRETDIRDYVRYLDDVLAHVAPPAGARVRAFGFSQGTATVFRWAALGASRIDELILWAGEVPADVDMARAAERLANTLILLVYGSRDELVPERLMRSNQQRLEGAGLTSQLYHYEGGHELDRELLTELISLRNP